MEKRYLFDKSFEEYFDTDYRPENIPLTGIDKSIIDYARRYVYNFSEGDFGSIDSTTKARNIENIKRGHGLIFGKYGTIYLILDQDKDKFYALEDVDFEQYPQKLWEATPEEINKYDEEVDKKYYKLNSKGNSAGKEYTQPGFYNAQYRARANQEYYPQFISIEEFEEHLSPEQVERVRALSKLANTDYREFVKELIKYKRVGNRNIESTIAWAESRIKKLQNKNWPEPFVTDSKREAYIKNRLYKRGF